MVQGHVHDFLSTEWRWRHMLRNMRMDHFHAEPLKEPMTLVQDNTSSELSGTDFNSCLWEWRSISDGHAELISNNWRSFEFPMESAKWWNCYCCCCCCCCCCSCSSCSCCSCSSSCSCCCCYSVGHIKHARVYILTVCDICIHRYTVYGKHCTYHCTISSWYMDNNQIKTTNVTICKHTLIPPKTTLAALQQAASIHNSGKNMTPNSSSIQFDSFLLRLEQHPHSHHPQSHTLAHGEGGLSPSRSANHRGATMMQIRPFQDSWHQGLTRVGRICHCQPSPC